MMMGLPGIKRSLCLAVVWIVGLVAPVAMAQPLSDKELEAFAWAAQLRFEVVSNIAEGGPQVSIILNNRSSVDLPAGESNWQLYIHSVRYIGDTRDAGLLLTHVQGDLHRLRPTADFAGLPAGEALTFSYSPSAYMASLSDFMPRAFVANSAGEAWVLASTDTGELSDFVAPLARPEQQKRSAADRYTSATAESRFDRFAAVNAVEVATSEVRQRIIPQPQRLETRRGEVVLNERWQIRYAGRLTAEARYLREQLAEAMALELEAEPDHIPAAEQVIILGVDTGAEALPAGAEAYTLDIESDRIVINGRDNAGAFYGIQSLLSLLAGAEDMSLPRLTIADAPRAHWRGMHYDMGRNVHGKAVTLRLIEQMGRYKLNKLHLHLTEDEGWRLEIPGLPELTEIGATRCFDLQERRCLLTQLGTGPHPSGSGNGYYSVDDFVDILRYAAERHIEVIPEIDMPGHARAAVVAMQARRERLLAEGREAEAERYLLSDPLDTSEYMTVQSYTDNSINVCLESTYAFVDKVLYELQQMYRQAGVPFKTFHMGGDEVGQGSWTASPACEAVFAREPGVAGPADLKPWFVSRVADLTSRRGLALAGWEDGLMYDASNTFNRDQFDNERVIAHAWDNIWEWGVADRAYRLANNGYQVVLSGATHLYFDHPHEPHPQERGYYWATRFTDVIKVFGFMPDHLYANADTTRDGEPIDNLEALVGRAMPPLKKPENLLGIQGQVWTETIRTPEQLEAMVFPRLLALAERAWHRANWEADVPDAQERLADYAVFARALVTRELPRLVAAGVNFHLLPPGGRREGNRLLVNTEYPGAVIEYRLDGEDDWRVYETPVTLPAETAQVSLRTRVGEVISRATALDWQ